MVHFEHYKSGHTFGIKYTFDLAGDCIPEHEHPPELAHNVVCTRGKLEVRHSAGTTCLSPGDVFDFAWSLPHTVIAKAPDSAALHLFLNGQPEGYDRLPPHEVRGTLGQLNNTQSSQVALT